MEEQLSSYERLIQALIDAVDTTVPLSVSGPIFPGHGIKADWRGEMYALRITYGHGDPFRIIIMHTPSMQISDAEDLTIASAYAMTGKFIALEAD